MSNCQYHIVMVSVLSYPLHSIGQTYILFREFQQHRVIEKLVDADVFTQTLSNKQMQNFDISQIGKWPTPEVLRNAKTNVQQFFNRVTLLNLRLWNIQQPNPTIKTT